MAVLRRSARNEKFAKWEIKQTGVTLPERNRRKRTLGGVGWSSRIVGLKCSRDAVQEVSIYVNLHGEIDALIEYNKEEGNVKC